MDFGILDRIDGFFLNYVFCSYGVFLKFDVSGFLYVKNIFIVIKNKKR